MPSTKLYSLDESNAVHKKELHFFYDGQNAPTFVEYNGIECYYIHNFHGDIVRIIDASGILVVEYKYNV